MMNEDLLARRLDASRVEVILDGATTRRLEAAVELLSARRRVRRRVWGGALALGLGAGFIATPAAADAIRTFLAQTGLICRGTECGADDSEMADLNAADLDDYLASVYPETYLLLPPGMSREDVIREVQQRMSDVPEHSTVPDAGIVGAYNEVAYCGWVASWLNANATNDFSAQQIAADAITQSLDWPGPLQTSPDPHVRSLEKAFAQAAREGDTDGVQTAAQFHACPAWDGRSYPRWLDAHRSGS